MSPWFHPNFPFETLLQWTWSNHHKSCQSLFLKESFHCHSNKLLSSLFSKKPSLSTDDLNNFHPISNLNFISKILEKVVASRIQSHLSSNSLSSFFQSAYRIFHSTETTLLKIQSRWPHPCDGSWWGHFSHSSRLICCLWFCRSFHPSHSSSKLVRSWWSFS